MRFGNFKGGQLNPLNQFTPYTMTAHPLRLLNPFNVLRRNAVFRGLMDGSKVWLAIGVVVWGPHLVRRILGKHSEHVAYEQLAIGHILRIEVLPQDTKIERKAFRRTK
jgi:hypothetical protein